MVYFNGVKVLSFLNSWLIEDKRGEGNQLFIPFCDFSLCKTNEEIKSPHLSIIIMVKLNLINSFYQEISNKIFINNVHPILVGL